VLRKNSNDSTALELRRDGFIAATTVMTAQLF
jgi:hypothetical protein